MAGLASLYEGAKLGEAFSTKLGQFQSASDETYQQQRGNLLTTGVATGKINPASLSSSDASLLGKNVIPSTAQPKGLLGDILGVAVKPFEVVLNTAGDFASAVEGLPTAAEGVWNAAARAVYPFAHKVDLALGLDQGDKGPPPGPSLPDIGKAIAQATVRDFTNFDPMHPLYPILDLASVASLGTTGAARLGAGLGRLGAEGSTLARVGGGISRAVKPGERPALQLGGLQTDIRPPDYSIAPFRRTFFEKPIDKFFASGYADRQVPTAAEGTTLQDLRAQYWIRKIAHTNTGRVSSGVVKNTYEATKPFAKAMVNLVKESDGSHAIAAEKFNALVLRRMLAADHLNAAQRAERLDTYINNTLKKPLDEVNIEGVATKSAQAKAVRDYYTQLLQTPRYRDFFVHGTNGMETVKQVWDQTHIAGLRSIGLDPAELLQRSLGPVAHLYEKTPEEMLREQPELVQKQTNFGILSKQVEDAIVEAKGEHVMQEALAGELAKLLPSKMGANLTIRTKLVRDAIRSLKADIQDGDRRINLHQPWYLPGNTLRAKVAAGLVDRLHFDTHLAEPYSIGALTNWFPQSSSLGLKVRQEGFMLGRIGETLSRGRFNKGAHDTSLHEFRKEPTIRLLTAQSLGVAPYSDYLHDAFLGHVEAGLERRDLTTFVRHISQRERVILHRMLAEPMIKRLAFKGPDGEAMKFGSFTELQNYIGDTEKAKKWVLVPDQALKMMIQSEGDAAREAVEALATADGKVTPVVSDAVDHAIDGGAQEAIRQISDSAIANKGKMVAMPRTFFDDLIKQSRTFDSGRKVGRYWQGFINRWRTAVLAYMPSWLLRTSIGHGLILYLAGVTDRRHYTMASTYFKDGFRINEEGEKISRLPPGVEQGTPHEDFGRFGGQRVAVNRLAQFNTGAVHRIANFQRRAAFLSLLEKTSRQRWTDLEDAMRLPHQFTDHTFDYIQEHHPELVHHALNELDRVSYTFGQMSPWERTLARNFIPFWGWYKFVNKFVWSLPVTYPGRTLAITRLGELGASQQDQLGAIPDWLRTAVLFDTHDLSKVHYLSMLGLNPLGDIANPQKGFQGLIRLGQFSPIIQAGLEGAGYNTLTGGIEEIDPASGIIAINGQYYNVHTGQVTESVGAASPLAAVERALGGLLREFPEVRIAEPFTTGGRAEYPESLPFIYEKPIPGSTPKPITPLHTLLQYSGVAPREYNLQKFQQKTLTNLSRARGMYRKAVRKSEAIR
jgi:hypothetical protein